LAGKAAGRDSRWVKFFEKKRADFGDRSAAKENEKKGRTQFLDRV
jgi:hypothetical protein